MHYYKRNIGDYSKKAGRLSMLEHGAYTLLIDACYDRERFPTRAEAIEWTWARSADEIAAVEFVLSRFFTESEDGTFVQSRIKEELDAYHEQARTNQRIALEREEKRRAEKLAKELAKETGRAEKSTGRARVVNEPLRKSHEPPPNQEPLTTNQEDNSTELSTSGKKFPDPHPDDLRLAEFILAGVTEAVPKTKPPNLHKWADTIRLMRERDRLSLREIAEVFTWANRNSFWRLNILSPDTLREKFPKLSAQKEQDHASSIRPDQRNPSSVTGQSTVGRAAAAANRRRAEILARNGGGPGAGDGGSVGADGGVVRGQVAEAVR